MTQTQSRPRSGTRWAAMNTTGGHFFSIYISASLLFSVLLLVIPLFIPIANAQSQATVTPLSVSGAATARTATKMYVQGGNHSGINIGQLFSLDLAVPWSTFAPAWTQHTNTGPAQVLFPAVFSKDDQTMVTFHSGGPTFGRRYSVLQDRWLPSAIAIENDFQGVGAVLDPDSGIVYITGGYTTRDMMSIYDFATDSIREAGMLPAPEFTLRARSYYGHVWCRTRKSIIYFGGYNDSLQPDMSANVLTEYIPSTNTWQTLTTTGFAPAMRADLCMAINDDGTKIVIFGGTLSSNLSYANDIFIIDLLTMTWRQGTSGLYRAYASCTMAGNQLIVWGGVDQAKRMVDNTILLYDIDHNAWGTSYTPPLSYVEIAKNQTNQIPGGTAGSNNESGGSSGGPNTGSSSSSKSHAGVIAAGVVGGLAVICAVALLCIFYKRKSPDAINTKKTKRRGIGGQESGTTELRDRKYSNEVAQNDEELQNLRQQVQNREEELELRRRLLQLQQEQQQHLLLQAQQVQHRQQVQVAPPLPYVFQPSTSPVLGTFDPFRNVTTGSGHPYNQQQPQPQHHTDPIKTAGGPTQTTAGLFSPMLPHYSSVQGGTSGGVIYPQPANPYERQPSPSSSVSSTNYSQPSSQVLYSAHPYRPAASPTPSYSLISGTTTTGSMLTTSQPPSRGNSVGHGHYQYAQQQHQQQQQQQQHQQASYPPIAAGGSTQERGRSARESRIGGGTSSTGGGGGSSNSNSGPGRERPRGPSPKNPQVGARERRV